MLYGDGYASDMGGLILAVRTASGKEPLVYINNLRNPNNPNVESLDQFLSMELRSRNLNPKWIKGIMEHGSYGAAIMSDAVENLWIWQVTTPGMVTDDMWNMVYETYILDKNNLGLKEYFNTNNPYAKQSMIARMVETIRKGYWNPSSEVKTALINEFIQSVNEYGVTCCHHTCGNLVLNQMMITGSSLSMEQLQQYVAAYASATGKNLNLGTPGSTLSLEVLKLLRDHFLQLVIRLEVKELQNAENKVHLNLNLNLLKLQVLMGLPKSMKYPRTILQLHNPACLLLLLWEC